MTQFSRRSMLKGGLMAGAAALTFHQLWGWEEVSGQANSDDAQTIANLAATAELYATTHYYTVLTKSSIALTPDEINILKGFLDAELQHLEILYENNAVPVTTSFYIPDGVYNDRDQFSKITEQIETTFVAAYVAATRQFAQLGVPLLAGTAAQVAAIEQEHLSIVRGFSGQRPNNVSLARALFYGVSDAVPALQPFLEGGAGYQGPITYPGADAIRDLVRDAGVVRVTAISDTPDFQAAATEDAAVGICSVTPRGGYNCNLRSGPGLSYPVVGTLPPRQILGVNGQSTDVDGFAWYRTVRDLQWIRSDIVRATAGECANLPTVSP